jgi:hypothetical protein
VVVSRSGGGRNGSEQTVAMLVLVKVTLTHAIVVASTFETCHRVILRILYLFAVGA